MEDSPERPGPRGANILPQREIYEHAWGCNNTTYTNDPILTRHLSNTERRVVRMLRRHSSVYSDLQRRTDEIGEPTNQSHRKASFGLAAPNIRRDYSLGEKMRNSYAL
jgi:hypothetical protein